MTSGYKTTLRNFEFHQLAQKPTETFSAFCNRCEKEGKTCTFCDCPADADCTSAKTARDQIVVGTNNEKIREQALLKSWPLDDLRKEGMKLESAVRGEEQISQAGVNKIGKYAFKNLPKQTKKNDSPESASSTNKNKCFRCGDPFIKGHLKKCAGIQAKCLHCSNPGPHSKVCKR